MALCPPPALLYTACPRVPCWDRSCLPCTPSLCQMWLLSIIVTITSTPMTLSCPKVPHLIRFLLFNPVFRHVLMMFCSGWIATSLSWTQIRLRLCPLALHLVLSRSTVSAQTLAETVFLSKRRLNALGSILIKRCQCRSISASSAVRPFYSSDVSRQTNRTCPKALQQDLLRQWSHPALIIATQFL